MRKVFAIAGGALALVLAGLAAFIAWAPLPRYPVPAVVFERGHASSVAEGRRLAMLMCEGCHFDAATRRFSGKPVTDLPPIFGTFRSANITSDPVFGIGRLSDADLARLIRTGIAPDGRSVAPMPTFERVSEDDLRAIIAFLRSDDPMVAPYAAHSEPSRPSFVGKAMARFVLRPSAYPAALVAAPPPGNPLALGRYLALDRLHCYECHSAGFVGLDHERPERSSGFFGGGTALVGARGETLYSRNLTPDPATGLGRWTDAEFVRAVRFGLAPGRRLLRHPMPMYAGLTDDEARAIFAYLKTVPPIRRTPPAGTDAQVTARATGDVRGGEAIYERYRCAQCHGTTGAAQHDLTQAEAHLGSPAAIEAWIRQPSRFKPGVAMPAWEGVIQPEEYPALVEYVQRLGRQASAGN
jgi:mono/diheme cytochrome c family protein